MTPIADSPRCFDPSYSLLGRAIRAWTSDRRRAEALFIVVLTGLALVLLMTHYLGWALLKPVLASNPSWQLFFWGGQLASVALLGAFGLVGFRPAVAVRCTSAALELTQGARTHTVPYEDIDRVETISATTYHRHYRRYANTDVFVSVLEEEVLLLRTAEGPVVVALPDPEDRAAVQAQIRTADVDVPEPVPQPQS